MTSAMPDARPSFQRISRGGFRIMLSGIFIVAGFNYLIRPDLVAARLASAPLGDLATGLASPVALVIAAGVALLTGGVALLVGWKTRWAAAGLLAIIIPISVTVQVGSIQTLGPLFKNIGLAGGLIYFIGHGADSFSLDSWWSRRREPPHEQHAAAE